MEGKVNNTYKVIFKDGTSFKSNGIADTKIPSIKNEFDWLSFHIQKELINSNKTLCDVKSINITIDFDINKKES